MTIYSDAVRSTKVPRKADGYLSVLCTFSDDFIFASPEVSLRNLLAALSQMMQHTGRGHA